MMFDKNINESQRAEKIEKLKIKLLDMEKIVLNDSDLAKNPTNKTIKAFETFNFTFLVHSALEKDKPISIKIERDGSFKDLTLIPKNIDGKGTIGAQLQPNIRKETKKTKNVFELFKYTNNEFSSLLVKTIQGYKGLITNFSSTAQQLSGPVKIVEIGAQLSQRGGAGILLFAALISINLAVLNSLPLPLLDGGQLVFTLIEGLGGNLFQSRYRWLLLSPVFFF